jgi:hypothetical protein
MSFPNVSASELCGACSCRSLLIVLALMLPLTGLTAQEHEEDHDHDHLHFSHPLVTESPSPDTKLRLDYIGTRTGDQIGLHENVVRLEGEYAFNHRVSVSIVTPFVWRTAPSAARASGLGNIEVSLKAASLMYGDRGLLIGGGLSSALPTGNDSKGIGSGHIVELEPFLDLGYKRNTVEFVGMTRASSTFHRRPGEEVERTLAFDFSALYQLQSRLEGLIELTTERALLGPDAGLPRTSIAPGLKVFPFKNRQIMFGASLELGTGIAHDTHALLVSGFYHF